MSVQEATLNMLAAVNAVVTKARRLHDGIPETVVVLGASGVTRTGQKHGHYAPRSWGKRQVGEADTGSTGPGTDSGDTREIYGEIFLAGESLGRGAVGTLGTILHELVHAYCYANDIKDTSNGDRYHNAKFRDKAGEFGLVVEKADTVGWSLTSVPESTQETYAAELSALEEAIYVHRLGYSEILALTGEDEPETKKPLKRYMQCPECEEPLLVTKKWWEKQGNGGGDYEQGLGLLCATHETEYELYEEGGEE